MKRKLITLFIALGTVFSLYAQEDSLRATRYVMRSTMLGVGHSNVFETYLSPLEYSGTEVRFMHESMRMTRMLGGNVSGQSLFQINASYNKNISQTAEMYAGLVNWSYALHYQFRMNDDKLKILVGPMLDLNGTLSADGALSGKSSAAGRYVLARIR